MERTYRPDRRVRRTKGLLQHALTALIHEKPYDAIAVKEILARADVGRTAFYQHFRNKDELLSSAFRGALGTDTPSMRHGPARSADVLYFSRPLLERIVHVRRSGHSMDTVAHSGVIHGRLRLVLQDHIVAELGRLPPAAAPAPVALDLLARHIADTFLLVLAWWAEHDDERSAAELDALFRSLVEPVLRDQVPSAR